MIAQDAAATRAELGKIRGFYRISPLAPSVCQVTYVAQAELGGSIPTALLNLRVKSNLKQIQRLQDKFERNGKVVDAEMVSAFPSPPPFAELNDEQKAIVESCRYLESDEGAAFEPLTSPSPFVDMWFKHAPAKYGERTIAVGKATGVIDCSMHDAGAYWYAAMSREYVRISNEQGNPAFLKQRENGHHDQVFATIKKMPFPLNNREFVIRQVCSTETAGDLLITTVSVNELADYGMSKRTVSGALRAVVRFTPECESQCKIAYCLYLDAGGRIPTRVLNSMLPATLGAVGDLRDEFQRDDEIDTMERDELARIIKDEPQTYAAEEGVLTNKVYFKVGAFEWERFEELESPDHWVKMGKIFAEGDGRMIIRASATVDLPMEECAAWDTLKMGRKNTNDSANLVRTLVHDNDHSAVFHFVKDFGVLGFAPREWVLRLLWKKLAADTVVVCYESIPGQNEVNNKYVRATNSVYNKYERLEPLGGVPQTRVTWTQKFELGGSIPRQIVNQGTLKQLVYLSAMRKHFDKSSEIDRGARTRNVEMIMGHDAAYDGYERACLFEGEQHFALFNGMKTKALKMASPLTTAEIAYKSGDKQAWGWATATVRARPEEVLAFCWDTMRRSAQREDDLEKSVEERINGHNVLVYSKKRTPKIIRDREFLGRSVWRKEGDGFFLVTSPEESDTRPIADGVVRGKYPSAMRIKRKNDQETKLEYLIHPDSGESIPSFVASRWMSKGVGKVTEIQEFFQELRRFEEWDGDDGRAVGEVMSVKNMAERYREKGESKVGARMRELFARHRGLKQFAEKYVRERSERIYHQR